MKQTKVKGYAPNYPKKLLKGAILTTAAAVALSGTAGCTPEVMLAGDVPIPTDELVLDGEVGFELPEVDPQLPGEPMPDDTCIEPDETSTGREGPALEGKIVVPEETDAP